MGRNGIVDQLCQIDKEKQDIRKKNEKRKGKGMGKKRQKNVS